MDWISLEGPAYSVMLVVAFLGVAMAESQRPARELTLPAGRRWGNHAVLMVLGSMLLMAAYRASPLLVAAGAQGRGWGLLNHEWIPGPVRVAGALLLLDFFHYAAHRLFHSFYFLWRIHEVHHSDADYDIGTSLRFHPLEALLTRGLYLLWVAVLAPPVGVVFAAEMLTLVVNSFVHGNVALPGWLERGLGRVIITPGLHRLHHSVDMTDQNRNFGQMFVWWDRMLGTYRETPRGPGETGVEGFDGRNGAWALVLAPFRRRE
jgi:sterol desaturase/sphingolipid hydroxylase (fatty acid hydroxylase superfamily)